MKSMMNKNLSALLVLAATGLPVLAQAAETQRIEIKANVGETISVDPVQAVDFGPERTEKTVSITLSSNLPGSTSPAKVQIEADKDDADGEGFFLKNSSSKLKINGTLESTKFDEGKAEVTAAVGTPVTLHLTPDTTQADAKIAGEYTGHLTVKVVKS